jgi:gamma-D-glutamyl-L-lysine dipeptidyl-peptidase
MTYSELQDWRSSERLIFTGLTGNVTDSDHAGKVVSDLVAGVIVNKMGENGAFFTVRLPDGRQGQVEKDGFADFSAWRSEAHPDTINIPETAIRFLGLPYMWGGTSSKTLDCSGFTKTVYFLNGLILERDASQQIRNGQVISPADNFRDLWPGDLLFYGNRDPFRVVHVGIWLGDSKVIHASGTVRVESMNTSRPDTSNYLTDTFLGEVRRITGVSKGKGLVPVTDHPWY